MCDNINNCHAPEIITEDQSALRVICKQCYNQFIIRKDWRGVPENRSYSEIFRKDSIQGNHPLFYKYYPQFLQT